MLKFIRTGEEQACTAPYDVVLDKVYTVQELIDTICSENERNYGYIGIKPKINSIHNSIFGEPNCEYYCGHIRRGTQPLPTEILRKTVKRVKARGGWGEMSYLIELEDN